MANAGLVDQNLQRRIVTTAFAVVTHRFSLDISAGRGWVFAERRSNARSDAVSEAIWAVLRGSGTVEIFRRFSSDAELIWTVRRSQPKIEVE